MAVLAGQIWRWRCSRTIVKKSRWPANCDQGIPIVRFTEFVAGSKKMAGRLELRRRKGSTELDLRIGTKLHSWFTLRRHAGPIPTVVPGRHTVLESSHQRYPRQSGSPRR